MWNAHKKSVPGWNDFVLEARKSASDAYKPWQQWNKPKHGPLFDLMQRTRAHYAVRFCRKHEQQIEADNYEHVYSPQKADRVIINNKILESKKKVKKEIIQ